SFVRFEPYLLPKRSLTNGSAERVDTRVLQAIYAFSPASFPAFAGQQVDVFIETPLCEVHSRSDRATIAAASAKSAAVAEPGATTASAEQTTQMPLRAKAESVPASPNNAAAEPVVTNPNAPRPVPAQAQPETPSAARVVAIATPRVVKGPAAASARE